MAYRVICFLWSPLLGMSALVLSGVVAMSALLHEPIGYFLPSLVLLYGASGWCWYAGRRHERQIHIPSAAWLMLLAWVVLSLAGMLPYALSGMTTWLDAWFDAVATVTTTGLVVCPAVYVQALPSFWLWRSALGWLGGLQFLAFVVTVLPLVSTSLTMSVQGRQNVSFSPMVHPMLGRTAKVLAIYVGITVAAILLYLAAGATLYEAVVQAGLTVSTTGGIGVLSPDSLFVELAALLPLLVVSGNFLLYLKGGERRSLRTIFTDAEWQVLVGIIVVATVIAAGQLWHDGGYTAAGSAVQGLFHVLSFLSTTGMMAGAVSSWPELDKGVLFILPFMGASMASLAGGLRVMRLIILCKMAKNELNRTIHPHMVISFTVNGRAVETNVVSFVLAYFFLFMTTYFVSAIILSLAGITPLQALGMDVGCLTSVGATAPLFGLTDIWALPVWFKLYSTVVMIVGRMEIFALCILIKTVLQAARRPW